MRAALFGHIKSLKQIRHTHCHACNIVDLDQQRGLHPRAPQGVLIRRVVVLN